MLGVLLVGARARAQMPDPRDYEVGYFVPSRTTVVNSYLRHSSGTKNRNVSANTALLRATYILKFGELVIAPIDLTLPITDVRGYVPLSSALGGAGTAFASVPSDLTVTTHASGVGDLVILPTIGHGVTKNAASHTHTWYALSTYITAPTGSYDPNRLLNVGQNRWVINPLIVLGQRFGRVLTAELMGNVALFMKNDDFRARTPELAGRDLTLRQRPSRGFSAHLAADLNPMFFLGASYYLSVAGRRELELPSERGTRVLVETPGGVMVHTFRLNFGLRVTPQTLIFVQWNEDVAGTASAPLGRYVSLRISHLLFAQAKRPVAQATQAKAAE
jgi:hypothetical protein